MGRMDFMEAMVESNVGFYIGDPCYVLDDEEYHKNWGDRNGFRDGEIQTDKGVWFVHDTAFGDGEYHDQYMNDYGVDSGTLAVIPLEVVYAHPSEDILVEGAISTDKMNFLGNVVMGVGQELSAEIEYVDGIFDVTTTYRKDGRTMVVEELEIDTYGYDDDDDEEDDDCWDDEDEEDEEDEE